MRTLRHPSPLQRRLTIALLALALLVRLLVPAGWMPVADAAGVRLVLCSGTMPAGAAMPRSAHGMATMHGEKAPMHQGSAADHPCAFAGPTAAPEVPALAVPPRFAQPIAAPALARRLVAVGRGLAAPPPPQTGPPAFA